MKKNEKLVLTLWLLGFACFFLLMIDFSEFLSSSFMGWFDDIGKLKQVQDLHVSIIIFLIGFLFSFLAVGTLILQCGSNPQKEPKWFFIVMIMFIDALFLLCGIERFVVMAMFTFFMILSKRITLKKELWRIVEKEEVPQYKKEEKIIGVEP